MNIIKKAAIPLLGVLLLATQLNAQYFGRNKPRYENFDFKVLQTPNFDIHHYLENEDVLTDLANASEHWYEMHQHILHDTFLHNNPMIIYNDHADFQQTNSIGGSIGIGTGGVTEGLRNRVIFPMAMSNEQTNHVLGHELVHAFQYHLIINGDSTNLKNMSNIPLWMIEGLAEYMSIGRVDAHTSMWMRDAVLNDDVPDIKKLNTLQYFPYRWGQAFWAFVAGLKGDEIIKPLFVSTAKHGLEKAILMELGMTQQQLSDLWVGAIKRHYESFLGDKKENLVGRRLLSDENSGELNVAPVLSPDGKYVIYLSEKGLFSIDLFLADAVSGKVIRKITSTTRDGHLDDINYIESAGTWSPDSKRIAFTAVRKGQNVLVIKDIESGKTVEEFEIKGVPAFSNPAWSPDGKSIVVAGLVNGQVDLYQVGLKKREVTQLTNNKYAELLPAWSADGRQIVFSTDQLSMERGRTNGKYTFNLAVINIENVDNGKNVENLEVFYGADNLNPLFDVDGNIIFLSNRDGFRNLYRYEPATQKTYQLTNLLTGVSGITHYAPAISTATNAKRNRVLYTHYSKQNYSIYRAKPEDFLNMEVSADSLNYAPATLLKVNKLATDIVDKQLDNADKMADMSDTAMVEVPYKSRFKLEYVSGGGGVGVGVSQGFGTQTGVAGGIDALFGDMLGNNKLFTSVSLNGEIQDFGAGLSYINLKNRLGWGVGISHTPFRNSAYQYAGREELVFNNDTRILADHFELYNIRTFEEKVSVFGALPFSKTLRLEGGLSYAFYNNNAERIDQYRSVVTGQLITQEREKIDPKSIGLNLFEGQLGGANIALVGDNSYFGIASPLKGHRYRIEVAQNFGDFNFQNVTIDLRKYLYARPVSFAFRALHTGRYGRDANRFFPNFIGYPWFVRGYDFNAASEILPQNGKSVNDLTGSKIGVVNAEIRLPFTGPERLSAIKSKFLFTELTLFADGGMAFDRFSDFRPLADGFKPGILGQVNPMFSVGASVRVNLFGALIVEPYYAIPLQKETRGVFGLNIVPGW